MTRTISVVAKILALELLIFCSLATYQHFNYLDDRPDSTWVGRTLLYTDTDIERNKSGVALEAKLNASSDDIIGSRTSDKGHGNLNTIEATTVIAEDSVPAESTKQELDDIQHVQASEKAVQTMEKELEVDQSMDTPAKKVLLLAYMRGGSSFLGEMFASNPDAFYWFEILHAAYMSLFGILATPTDVLYTLNGAPRQITKIERTKIHKTLNSFYNCDLEELPIEMLLHDTVLHSGPKWAGYIECIENTTATRFQEIFRKCHRKVPMKCQITVDVAMDNECQKDRHFEEGQLHKFHKCIHEPKVVKAVHKCLPKLKSECLKSPIRATKVLRMYVDQSEKFIKEMPALKVLHQMRDPRGTLMSTKYMNFFSKFSGNKLDQEAMILCDKMMNDLTSYRKLKRKYYDNYLQIKYENYAKSPMETLDYVYNFIREPVPAKLKRSIYERTHSNWEAPRGSFGTHRRQSAATARMWELRIKPSERVEIEEHCSKFLAESDYKNILLPKRRFVNMNRK